MMILPDLIQSANFVLLDLETTDINRNKAEAVQIAFAVVDRGRPGLRGYYTLRPHREIQAGASAKHGFTAEKLQHSPQFADVAGELFAILSSRVVLGFNALQFDVPILRRLFQETQVDWSPKVLDVLPWARRLLTGGKHTLGDCAARLQVPPLPTHDAWNDCKLTWGVFGALAVSYPELGSLTLDDALAGPKKVS